MGILPFRRQVLHLIQSPASYSPSALRNVTFRIPFLLRTMATQAQTEREILPTNVVPTHYRLSLTPNFSTFKYEGKVDVRLDVAKPTSSIVLNATELELHSASITTDGKSIASKKISLDEEKQIATLEFEEEVKAAKDSTTLHIDFTGILNDKMAGFYRSSYIDVKSGEKKWLATTQMGTTQPVVYSLMVQRTHRCSTCIPLLG